MIEKITGSRRIFNMFTFGIVFSGGFALVATCRELQFLLERDGRSRKRVFITRRSI